MDKNDKAEINGYILLQDKKTFISSKNLFFLYILCLISAVVYSVLETSLLGFLIGGLICALVFFTRDEDYFVFVFGLQFLISVIPITIGTSKLGFIIFVYAIFVLRILLGERKIFLSQILLLMLMCLDILTSAFSNIFKIGDNINWAFSFIYAIYIIKVCIYKIDFQKLFIFFLLAQWAICIINIIAEYRILGQTLIPTMYGKYNDVFGFFAFGKAYSQVSGGNGISFNNSLAVSLCILLWPYAKKKSVRIVYLISILFLGYCGMMVVARAFYVELLLFLCLLICSTANKPSKLIIYAIMLVIIGAGIYFFAYDNLLITFERVFERFEAGNNNRILLLNEAIELWSSNPLIALLGAGTYYPDVYNFTAHNLYLDVAVSLGGFGFIIYWSILVKLFIDTLKKYIKFSLKALIPMIMLLVFKLVSGSTRDVGFYYYFVLVIAFAVYISPKRCIGDK